MKKTTSLCAFGASAVILLSACQTTGGPAAGTGAKADTGAALSALSSIASVASGTPSLGGGGDKVSNLTGAVQDGVKAFTISDEEIKQLASSFAKQSDAENKVAPESSPYAKRLTKLTKSLTNYDGMNLNFKVYQSENVNAFAMADGTVRVYSGLMDLMNDDELRFVIGHEIAHVKLGHNQSSIKTAYLSSSAVKAGAGAVAGNSRGGAQVMSLAGNQIKEIFQKVLTSAHSRSQESEADAYSVQFMKKNKIPSKAASAALLKLAKGAGNRGASFLSSHPAPADRAVEVDKLAAK